MTRDMAIHLAKKAAIQLFHDFVITPVIKENIMKGEVLIKLNAEEKIRVSVAAYWLGYKVTDHDDGLVLSWV